MFKNVGDIMGLPSVSPESTLGGSVPCEIISSGTEPMGTQNKAPIINDYSGKREVVISAKISPALNDAICNHVDGSRYKSKNDILEEALLIWINEKEREGC